MTLGAGSRPAGVACGCFGFMALDAQLVHDLLFRKLALGLKPLNTAFFLGKYFMAYLAVFKPCLVPVVGEMNLAAAAAVQYNRLSSFVNHG
jgi:hypothetical protein